MRQPVQVKPGYPFGATPYPLRIINPDGTVFGFRHGGQDYPCAVGTQVVAPHGGKVTFAGPNGSAGNEVRIVSGNMQTRLLHNSVIQVKAGQMVSEGQAVAKSGNTGFTTGPHVHWYLSINGKYVNPLLYVTPPSAPTTGKMPPVGSSVRFTINRTAFKAGTTTVAGTLPADIRVVRGYDPVYGNRILVNSASLGNGVAVALYMVNGSRIEGWTTV